MVSREISAIKLDKKTIAVWVLMHIGAATVFYLFLRYLWMEWLLVAAFWSVFYLTGGVHFFYWRGYVKLAILTGLLVATIAALVEFIWRNFY
jgi:hypothetical protein